VKWSVFITLTSVILGSTIAAASPPPAPELTTNPLVLLLIGSIIGSISPLLVVYITNRYQLGRDKLAHERQVEREQVTYERSLKDAKRERLRKSYKTLLDATNEYQFEIEQINHMPSSANISVTGVDEAVTEIILDDDGADVRSIFYELRGAFHDCIVKQSTHDTSRKQDKETVLKKVEEIKTAMNRNLDELDEL
jgi:hypothetical protein